jgi:hypothetical protein
MECSGFISIESCSCYLFVYSCFPVITRGPYLFSGTYLNKLSVSMVLNERIAPSKGSSRLGDSLSEDGSRAGFEN